MIEFIGLWSDIQETDGRTYGAAISCRAEGSDEFQPATSLENVWIYRNEVLPARGRIPLEPGTAVTVILDLKALEGAYGESITAVRVECGTPGSRRQAVFTEYLNTAR